MDGNKDWHETLLQWLDAFCMAEYGGHFEYDDRFGDPGLLYSTVTTWTKTHNPDEADLQIDVDLIRYDIKFYLNNVLYKVKHFGDTEDMYEWLEYDDFNSLYSYAVGEARLCHFNDFTIE